MCWIDISFQDDESAPSHRKIQYNDAMPFKSQEIVPNVNIGEMNQTMIKLSQSKSKSKVRVQSPIPKYKLQVKSQSLKSKV